MNGHGKHQISISKLSNLSSLQYRILSSHTSDWTISSPALTFSFFLHLIFLYLLLRPTLPLVQPTALSVEFVKEEELNKNQIVLEPQNEKSPIAPETNLEAEENHLAIKEQVARGDPLGGSASKESRPSKQQPATTAPQQSVKKIQKSEHKKPLEKVAKDHSDNLTIPLSELGNIQWKDGSPQTRSQNSSLKDQQVGSTKPAPFSRPAGSGASMFGSADLLPNLPDGDMTFLNTKASQFAVFVRRVALSVFGEIKQLGWEQLSSSEIQAIRDSVEVHAVLSKSGALESVFIVTPSGSKRFDSTISQSIHNGARDSNPPAEAARPDGKFEFIFRAKSWSMVATSRHGGFFERRWLQLETGLE
jgi:hypothetical protein